MLQVEFLNHTEDQLEEQLKEMILVFQNLPEAVMLKAGPNNGWSIAACIAHLNSYAEYYLPRLEEALNKSAAQEETGIFKHSLLGKYFINSMDAAKSNKKFKALKRHTPIDVGDPNRAVTL